MAKSASVNAEEKSYRAIINLILNGEIRPGEFLLEEELAKNFKMSRTPIGRALTRLVTEGFLDRLPKKGCYVPIPTPEDADAVYKARMAVEVKTAAEAALQATDEEIAELEKIAAMDEEAVVTFSRESYSNINEALHLGIAKIARNPYLEKWCRYIYWRATLYVFYLDSFYIAPKASEIPPQATPRQHKELILAIKRRDPLAAERAMEEHLVYNYHQLFGRHHKF